MDDVKGMDFFTNTVSQLAWAKDIDLTKGQALITDPDKSDMLTPSPTLTPSTSRRQNQPEESAFSLTERPTGLDKLADSVQALAWMKDIDLTKGDPFIDPQKSPAVAEAAPVSQVPNGSAVKTETETELRQRLPDSSLSQIKRKKNLNYNRVSPLLNPRNISGAVISGVSDDAFQRDNEGFIGDQTTFSFPVSRSDSSSRSDPQTPHREGSPTRNVVISDDSNRRIIQSEFSISADSSSASEIKPDVTFPKRKSKHSALRHGARSRSHGEGMLLPKETSREVEVLSSTSSLKDASEEPTILSVSVSQDIEVQHENIELSSDSRRLQESSATGSSGATSSTRAWLEEQPQVMVASPSRHRKRKEGGKKGKGKSKKKADSASSLVTLLESTSSKDDVV